MKDLSSKTTKKNPKKPTSSTSVTKPIRDKAFKIKIADLLNEAGSEDTIVFANKFTDQLTKLDDNGISWSFTIQSLDKTSLLGTLTDVSACFHETCDSCGAPFERKVVIPSYVARFTFEEDFKKNENDTTEEVVFFIDPKSEFINIEDMVVQAILLNDPFALRCDACAKRLEAIDDEDDLGEFQSKWNIVFS